MKLTRVLAPLAAVVMCGALIGSIAPHAAASPTATPAAATTTTSPLLPQGVHAQPALGDREVWLLPVATTTNVTNLTDSLTDDLDHINEDLDWFSDASSGKFTFTATKVLPPVVAAADDCKTTSAAAFQRWQSMDLPEGVHVVAVGPSDPGCRLGGHALVPGTFAYVQHNTFGISGQLLIHELGHNLGLPHATRAVCSERTCHDFADTYGDPTDPMGFGGWDGTSFHATHLAYLGWSDDGAREYRSPTRKIRIPAMARENRPDAAVIHHGGNSYVVTYRKAVRGETRDTAFVGINSGITIHVLSDKYTDPARVQGAVYDMTSLRPVVPERGKYDPFGQRKDVWTDPDTGLSIKVVNTKGGSATIKVTSSAPTTPPTP